MAMPAKLPIQIIGPTTIAAARAAYFTAWNRKWPHGDSYLAELVIDAKAALGIPAQSKARPKDVRADVLVLMRLDHEFAA